MIRKILRIENVGLYNGSICQTDADWNGEFKKNTVIYGENGSGKTTLSMFLSSLKGNDGILKEKRRIGSEGEQKASVLLSDSSTRNYTGDGWDKHYKNIEIFDIHFVEDNILLGSSLQNSNQANLFEIIVGKHGIELKGYLDRLYAEKENIVLHRRIAKQQYSKILKTKNYKNLEFSEDYSDERLRIVGQKIKEFNIELGEYSSKIFESQIVHINRYLRYFTPYMQIEKFSKLQNGGKQFVSYSLSVSGEKVGFEKTKAGRSRKIKYTLSEGDKSALAFSFFLSRLEVEGSDGKIVVFDDPISSFDLARRNATINQLYNVSKACDQLIVTTHDVYFARALVRKLSGPNTIELKIEKTGRGSVLKHFDSETETIGGIYKDIMVLRNCIANGAASEVEKREVVRCIRPIIEGIIRIKYFTEISKDEWLGDMLAKIKASQSGDRLHRLLPLVDNISEINDYSKEFHHSDPTNPWGDMINNEELRLYVERTMDLIDQI